MCRFCADIVKKMDIRDSDLPHLPYKLYKWQCMVPRCKGYTKIRDYGIAPFYWHQRKIIQTATQSVGGWCDLSIHYWMCGKHYTPKSNHLIPTEITTEMMLSKIVEITKAKK